MSEKYRQGEVIVNEITEQEFEKEVNTTYWAPKLKENGVLAEGEKTGHKHEVVRGAKVYVDRGGRMYIKVEKKTILKHPEHAPIILKRGKYSVDIQREYDERGSRNVLD